MAPIHIILKISSVHGGFKSSAGYIHLIDFTISSTDIGKSAFDLESSDVLYRCKSSCYDLDFHDLEQKFPVLKRKKFNSSTLVGLK